MSDCPNNRVQVYNSSHIYVATIGVNGVSDTDNSHFNCPKEVEVDSSGNIFVADNNNNRVQKFNSSRVYQITFGTVGSSTNSFADVNAEDVTVDAQGRVYIAGWDNRVEVFDATGAYLTTIGGAYGNYSSQNRGYSGVAIDSQGNVYVSDNTNARIQKFSPGVPGWRQANINGFGNPNYFVGSLEPFNGSLYASASNWNGDKAQIWRSTDGHSWTNLSNPAQGITSMSAVVLDMTTFKGQLYAGTGWTSNQGSLWRTANGVDWTAITTDSFGVVDDSGNVDALAVYNGKIYASHSGNLGSNKIGASIFRSDNGDPGTWTPVVNAGNGDPQNVNIDQFAEFNGALYAVGQNLDQGAFIWKSSPDGSTWSQVGSFGLDSSNQDEAITLAVFNGQLYLGTYNGKNAKPGQVWRTANGTTWTPVVNNGFGDPNNTQVVSLYSYARSLFATVGNSQGGIQLWRSSDGLQWMKIAPDGLGNSNNSWILRGYSATTFNGSLYMGLFNQASGLEVWQMFNMVYLPMIKK